MYFLFFTFVRIEWRAAEIRERQKYIASHYGDMTC